MPKKTRLITIRYPCFIFLAAIIFSCAGSPKGDSRDTPLWVTEPGKAYPDRDWICVVGSGQDAKSAENAALEGIARVFRVDLVSITNANRQFTESISIVNGKKNIIATQISDLAQELTSNSTVSGLIGLKIEPWTRQEGSFYVNARMNRKECSARYSVIVRENAKVIDQLLEEAEQNPRTFEAFQMLNLAYNIATVTDNFHNLLTVLDPSTIARLSYGNAEVIKRLTQNAGRSVVVTVKVEGDNGGRIERSFTRCFNSRGFRTGTAGNNPYVLASSLQLENANIENPDNYKYIRYILNYSLKDKEGVEIFSSSINGRVGHLIESEARQTAIRAVENIIASENFAADFDAFLASLL